MRVSLTYKVLTMAVAVLFLFAFSNGVSAKASMHKLSGQVVSVDPGAKSFVVKEKKGEATIMTDEMTKVTMGKEQKAFDDIKAGEIVKVKYHEKDGKMMAYKVLLGGKHAGKMKTEKKAEKAPEKHD